MSDSPIQGLIDLLNKLSEKYNFEESDINELKEKIFKIETGESAIDGDMAAQDFVEPEGDNEDEYDEYED